MQKAILQLCLFSLERWRFLVKRKFMCHSMILKFRHQYKCVYTYTYMYIYIFVYIPVRMYVHTCMYICIYANMCVCI